ncbi:MAG: glycerol-3-phosphate acyltransferase, partial [Lachnospiraceae bacterium]|nr:glycerol-3-phosphate acyltransferase [Lachnospiraceae bacterium]
MIIDDIGEEIIILNYIYRIVFSIFSLFLGYMLGSIPFGVIVSKTKGVDIMKKGSCSPGYTNVKRVLGFRYGIIVFILDLLKTFVAIFISIFLLSKWSKLSITILFDRYIYIYHFSKFIILLTGLGAILGHNYPLF